MFDFIFSICDAISDAISKIFFDETGNCNTIAVFFLAFAGVTLLLSAIFNVFKIFSLHCKNDLSLEENLEPKKNDIKNNFKDTSVLVSSHKVPLFSNFSCDYCGSISSDNTENCRNCGSNDFTKLK